MTRPSPIPLSLLPEHTARKEWYALLTLIDDHRKNAYITIQDYAKMLGQSYGWTHLLLNPYHRNNQGKKHPTYPLDVAGKLAQVLELELHVGDHPLERVPALLESTRTKYRITYKELAQLYGVNTMTVHRWLKGATPMPIGQAIRMLDLFTLPPIEIAGALLIEPANPYKKPRGQGAYAKKPSPDAKPAGMHIGVDGQVVWDTP